MKKILMSLVAALALSGGAFQAQEKTASGPATANVAKLDSETVAWVAKVRPAFVHIGGGSGVCISEDGYFLTNHHVFNEAPGGPSIKTVVKMAGSTRPITAVAVGADPRGDIVLGKMQLKEGEKVPFVKLADSDKVQIGDLCLSVGDPFLLGSQLAEPTITLGTITGVHRFQGGYCDSIQIDTAINPGNSGGPSFNLDGEVIGINGRNIANHGKRFNTGAGYAIPANQIRNFLDTLKGQSGGAYVVRHGLVGGLKISLGISAKGATVEGVDADSEASDAGFKDGDVIVKIDSHEIFNGFRYHGVIGTKPRGSSFKFSVKRGSEMIELSARNDVPSESGQFGTIPRTDDEARKEGTGAGGLMGDPFKLPDARSTLGVTKFARNKDRKVGGFVLESFKKDGPAEAAGLQAKDILVEIGGRKIFYVCDISDIMIAVEPNTPLLVKYIRNGETLEATVITAAAPRRGR